MLGGLKIGINMILIVGGFVAGIFEQALGVGGGVILIPFLSFDGMSPSNRDFV